MLTGVNVEATVRARARAQGPGDRVRRARPTSTTSKAPVRARGRRHHRRHRRSRDLRRHAGLQGGAEAGRQAAGEEAEVSKGERSVLVRAASLVAAPTARFDAASTPSHASHGLAKRIIPCLDVTDGRVVKGVNFVDLRDAGDPVEIARRYDEQGADELTFLDITASVDERGLIVRHDRGGRRPGLHPAHGRRRRAHASRTCAGCSTPAPTRSASTPRRCRTRSSSARRRGASARSASSSRSTRSARRIDARWEVFTHGGRTPDRPRCGRVGARDAGARRRARSC